MAPFHHLPQSPPHSPLLQSHTNQPSGWQPLLYLLLRYRPALSPAWYYVQYAAGNTRSIHTSREREYPEFDPSLLSLSLSLSRARSFALHPLHRGGAFRDLLLFSSFFPFLFLFFFDGSRIPSMLIRALFGTLLCRCRNATRRQSEIDESALCFDLIKWRADWRGLN